MAKAYLPQRLPQGYDWERWTELSYEARERVQKESDAREFSGQRALMQELISSLSVEIQKAFDFYAYDFHDPMRSISPNVLSLKTLTKYLEPVYFSDPQELERNILRAGVKEIIVRDQETYYYNPLSETVVRKVVVVRPEPETAGGDTDAQAPF